MNVSRPLGSVECEVNANSEAGSVGFDAVEADSDPVVVVAGVLEECVLVPVAGKEPAQLVIEVLVTVVVDVDEGDAVTLLEMSEPARGSDVQESLPPIISQHDVGHQGMELRIASRQVNVEPAVVVDVAEVGAHGKADAVEASAFGHIAEAAIAVVVVQTRKLRPVLPAERLQGQVVDARTVGGDEEVEPAIVPELWSS